MGFLERFAPFLLHARFLERIVSQRLVGPARGGFRDSADYAVDRKEGKDPGRAIHRSEEQSEHFQDHANSGKDKKSLSAQGVGQRTGGYLEQNDRDGPYSVEDAELFPGQAVLEKIDREDRVIKPGVEKHPEANEKLQVPHRTGFRIRAWSHRDRSFLSW